MNDNSSICCLCLIASNNLTHFLCDFSANNISYYEKLSTSFPQLVFDGKYDDYMLCKKCCDTVNLVYEFSNNCVKNLRLFIEYKTELTAQHSKTSENAQISVNFVKCEITHIDKKDLVGQTAPDNSNNSFVANVKIEPDDKEIEDETYENLQADDSNMHTADIHVKTEDLSNEVAHSVFSSHNAIMSKTNCESENTTKSQRKRISLDIKLQVLKRFEAGERQVAIGTSLNLATSTIRTIIKNADKIRTSAATTSKLSVTRVTRSRSHVLEKMEKKLCIWIDDQAQRNLALTQLIVMKEARNLFTLIQKETGDTSETFIASKGWFERFKKRSNLHSLLSTNEAARKDKP